MQIFDIAASGGSLGAYTIQTGNTQKFRCRFANLLDFGVILTDATAAIDADTATVSVPVLADDRRSLSFFLTVPDEETFTVTVTVETSDEQTLVYTIEFTSEE